MYIVYDSPLNLLDIGLLTIIIIIKEYIDELVPTISDMSLRDSLMPKSCKLHLVDHF